MVRDRDGDHEKDNYHNQDHNGKRRSENERETSAESSPGKGENGGQSKWYDELDSPEDKDNRYAGRGERRRNQKRRLKISLLAAGGILLLLVIGVGVYAYSLLTDIQEPQRVLLDDAADREDRDYEVDEAFVGRAVNIALLGFDRGWGREKHEDLFRPDAIAVFSINFTTEEVSVVRITRDAYVPIYGMGGFHDKINHAYRLGYQYGDGEDSHEDGIKYTLETISHTLGDIPIHYYISVDMYSVIELVDAVGGIYYEVEETIYDPHDQPGQVLVPEGSQVMDGKTYLRYLQYRDEATDQDYGRIERQMSLLEQTLVCMRDRGKLTDLPSLYRIYMDYVETDLSYTQIAALAYFARDLETRAINVHVLPGDGQTRDGIWYQILKQDQRLEIIREVFGVEAERWPPIVLEDSPEYLEEQERLRREEEREQRFRRDDDGPGLRDENPAEQEPAPEEEPGQGGNDPDPEDNMPGEEEVGTENGSSYDPDPEQPGEGGEANDNW